MYSSLPKRGLLFNYWIHWVFTAVHRLSLVAANGGYSLAVVYGLFISVVSLVADHGL